MRTTWRGIWRTGWVASLVIAVGLQGCASTTDFARPGTDTVQMKADSHACEQWEAPVEGAAAGAGIGALWGVASAESGAASDRDAAIMAGIFALLYGVAYGLSFADQDATNYDRCMVAKGYHPV